jgi:hypothetical protein
LDGEVIITAINGTEGTTTINGSHITTGSITADHIAASTITTSKLNFDINDMITAGIEAFEDGMQLSVTNGEKSSIISLTSGGITLSSETISFTGDVVFASELAAGTTTISGDCIKTGTIDALSVTVSNLNASSITTGTLSVDRLNLKGITIKNTAGRTTFAVDTDGNVTVDGSADSVIKLANGTYDGGSFIDGTTIKAPTIQTSCLSIKSTETTMGGLQLYASGQKLALFDVHGYQGQYVIFTGPNCASTAKWDFDYTYIGGSVQFKTLGGYGSEVGFHGNVSFTDATVTGLTAVAVFG